MACGGVGFFAVAISANTTLYARRNNSDFAHYRTPHSYSVTAHGLKFIFRLLLFPCKTLGHLNSNQPGDQDRCKKLPQDRLDLAEGHCGRGLRGDITVT